MTSGHSFEVPPLSRHQIRDIARKVRALAAEMIGTNGPFFDIVRFLDVTLPKVIPEFTLEILEDRDLGEAHGMTYPDRHLIKIPENVYIRAHKGHGRDRLTLAHELGHYLLHSGLGLARTLADESVKPYRKSEWQANAFGGELLMSADLIHLCHSPIEATQIFGVSHDAAITQWRAFEKDGLVR